MRRARIETGKNSISKETILNTSVAACFRSLHTVGFEGILAWLRQGGQRVEGWKAVGQCLTRSSSLYDPPRYHRHSRDFRDRGGFLSFARVPILSSFPSLLLYPQTGLSRDLCHSILLNPQHKMSSKNHS